MSKERFTVEECIQCSDDRKFQNNKCVYNNRLGFEYFLNKHKFQTMGGLKNGLRRVFYKRR